MALAPYWAEQLQRTQLVGRQLSAREGNVQVRIDGNDVVLSGRAVTVAHGSFLVPRLAEFQAVAR